MTTTWQIFDTKYTVSTGLITRITYGCTVQTLDVIERKVAELEVTGDISSPEFTPYGNLTEEIIINWVKAYLTEEGVLAIETELQDKATARQQAKQAETEKNGLPWL